jgi:hypothetical protein
VPNLWSPEDVHGVQELRTVRKDGLRPPQLVGGGEGADLQVRAILMDVAELGEIRQGDEVARGLGASAKIHQEVCAPGQGEGVGAQVPEEGTGLGKRGWPVVFEGRMHDTRAI